MATVWAPYQGPKIGVWDDRAYAAGWSHTISFASLADLVAKMKKRGGLQGKVTRLGIVAHGDEPGVVQLDRKMTRTTLPKFKQEFEQLRWFLTKDAMVIFYSCIAGKAAEGDRFLKALSSYLEGRTVVGFTLYGESEGQEGLPQSPGNIVMRESSLVPASRTGPYAKLNPWHPAGKWARNGQIVRIPALERTDGNRCANPRCRGHRSPLHHCVGWQ